MCRRTRAATSFIGSTLERMTQVHQRPSIVRTTLICRRSRISAQLLLVDPGAGGAHGGHPGDERILSRPQPQGEGANDPSAATSACPSSDSVGALLDAPHLVHRCVGMPDDVELVEGDAGVGQLLGAALDEGRRLGRCSPTRSARAGSRARPARRRCSRWPWGVAPLCFSAS